MGYYSDFEILVDGVDNDTDLCPIADALEEIVGEYYSFEVYSGALHSGDRYKWYDHEEHLAELSKLYPGTLIETRVTGEDSERWVVFAKDGKVYSEYLSPNWPTVDESKFSA